MPMSVDIVLPCYNPNEKWHLELLDFYSFISEHYRTQFIIVNDGSVATNLNSQIEFLQKNAVPVDFISYSTNKGKGFALRRGVSVAMSDYIMYTDIDFPFTNKSALDLLQTLVSSGSDVVAGYRDHDYYINKMTAFRRSLSKTFRYFIKKGLRMDVTDTQCGLKAFNRKGREKFLATKTNRYLFDFEFIFSVCKDRSLKIKTVQAHLKADVVFSKMKPGILFQESLNLVRILMFPKSPPRK